MIGQWRRVVLSLVAALAFLSLSLIGGLPVYAAPPSSGTVVEGHSVPRLTLGATRKAATAAWGKPSYCQNMNSGDQALCTYNISGGSVDLTFSGPGGGNPTGRGTDIVARIDWIGMAGWKTTAGVTAPSALAHPHSVIDAYPNGKVVRYGDGHLYSVTDDHLGIQVEWIPITYSSQFYVVIAIYPGK